LDLTGRGWRKTNCVGKNINQAKPKKNSQESQQARYTDRNKKKPAIVGGNCNRRSREHDHHSLRTKVLSDEQTRATQPLERSGRPEKMSVVGGQK